MWVHWCIWCLLLSYWYVHQNRYSVIKDNGGQNIIIQSYCRILASHKTVLTQYTSVVNSVMYVGHVTLLDTTVKSVLEGHPILHGQMSRDDRIIVQYRMKCSDSHSTMHKKLPVIPARKIFSLFTQDRFNCMCTSMKNNKRQTKWYTVGLF